MSFMCPEFWSQAVEANIEKMYKENIVYQWLRKPCLSISHNKRLLNPNHLFYISFYVLDMVKRYTDMDDCRLKSEIECIPYEIESYLPLKDYRDDDYPCAEDRLLVMVVLYELLRMVDVDNPDRLTQYLIADWCQIIPSDCKECYGWDSNTRAKISTIVKGKSPIYAESSKFMQSSDYSDANKMHLIDYVQGYVCSKRRISDEIERLSRGESYIVEKLEPNISECSDAQELQSAIENEEIVRLRERVEELEAMLARKDDKIADLKNFPIEISSTCKSKIVVLLSAMYYANYFHYKGSSNRKDPLRYILRNGFGYGTKSISQTLSSWQKNGGKINDLKNTLRSTIEEQLEEALSDLTRI